MTTLATDAARLQTATGAHLQDHARAANRPVAGQGMATILGIWAHPDDEVFVAGGFMAGAVRAGGRVVCVHMTRGEAGLSYRRSCDPETLTAIRERELAASLTCLGVEDQRFFGYPDGALASVGRDAAVGRIHDVLVEVRPDVVVTFGPDGFTGHPDHRTLSAWVTAAVGLWDQPGVCLYHVAASAEWNESFAPALNEFDFFWPGYPLVCADPDVILQLDGDLAGAKVEALRAHASQMQPLFDAYGEDFMRALASTERFRLSDPVGASAPQECWGDLEEAMSRTGSVPEAS